MPLDVTRIGEFFQLIIPTDDEDAERVAAPDIVKTLTRDDALKLIRLLFDAVESDLLCLADPQDAAVGKCRSPLNGLDP